MGRPNRAAQGDRRLRWRGDGRRSHQHRTARRRAGQRPRPGRAVGRTRAAHRSRRPRAPGLHGRGGGPRRRTRPDVGVAPELLEPLRRLAGRRREFAEPVLRAALAALSRGPVTAAGRCVADFPELLSPAALDEQVCRSLVLLAGAPRRDSIGRSRPSQTADPTGLRAATEIAPGVVTAVLRRLLPPPARPRSLILPTPEPPRPVVTDFERAAAGAAIATLVPTHPRVAEQMIPTLILDLGVPAATTGSTTPRYPRWARRSR